MAQTIMVHCPCCERVLEVNPETAKVVRHFESKTKGKTKDQAFWDALEETKHRENKLAKQFDTVKFEEKEKMKRLEEKFKEKKKKIDSGEEEEGPLRPFDLD